MFINFSKISLALTSLALLTPSALAQAQFSPVNFFRAGELSIPFANGICDFTNGGFVKFQTDGNLVAYNFESVALWAASNFGAHLVPDFPAQQCTSFPTDGLCTFTFQGDGNLVTSYDGVPLWNSATQGRGEWLVCQEEAPWLYIVDGDGNTIWSTSSGPTVL